MLKDVKVGDLVELRGFTGIKLSVSEVAGVNKTEIELIKKSGDVMVFDKATGKQKNAANPKYANTITKVGATPAKKPVVVEEENDEEVVTPSAKKAKKPAKKPVVVEEEDEFEDDLDDDEFEDIDE